MEQMNRHGVIIFKGDSISRYVDNGLVEESANIVN